jgi:hypothetical protein
MKGTQRGGWVQGAMLWLPLSSDLACGEMHPTTIAWQHTILSPFRKRRHAEGALDGYTKAQRVGLSCSERASSTRRLLAALRAIAC